MTHSIDLAAGRQASAPVVIGEYGFVGTNCVLLGGSVLPERCVLGAKSLLNKAWTEGGDAVWRGAREGRAEAAGGGDGLFPEGGGMGGVTERMKDEG